MRITSTPEARKRKKDSLAAKAWSRIQRKPVAVKVMKDGREICQDNAAGKREYQRRRSEAYERDNGICCLCGAFLGEYDATTEHIITRGGGKRDDRVSNLGVSHLRGNSRRGSVAYELYMQHPEEQRRRWCGLSPQPSTMERLVREVQTGLTGERP